MKYIPPRPIRSMETVLRVIAMSTIYLSDPLIIVGEFPSRSSHYFINQYSYWGVGSYCSNGIHFPLYELFQGSYLLLCQVLFMHMEFSNKNSRFFVMWRVMQDLLRYFWFCWLFSKYASKDVLVTTFSSSESTIPAFILKGRTKMVLTTTVLLSPNVTLYYWHCNTQGSQ